MTNDVDLEMTEAAERADEHAAYWDNPWAFPCASCQMCAEGFTGLDDEYLCQRCFLEDLVQ
jgi:hypothetical protein